MPRRFTVDFSLPTETAVGVRRGEIIITLVASSVKDLSNHQARYRGNVGFGCLLMEYPRGSHR